MRCVDILDWTRLGVDTNPAVSISLWGDYPTCTDSWLVITIGYGCRMELRHLRYFVAVAEQENVTRAAAKLRVSQPGVSHQIHDLGEKGQA